MLINLIVQCLGGVLNISVICYPVRSINLTCTVKFGITHRSAKFRKGDILPADRLTNRGSGPAVPPDSGVNY